MFRCGTCSGKCECSFTCQSCGATRVGAPNHPNGECVVDTTTQESAIVLDTPPQIAAAGILQLIYRLALEINNGMKFRQSTLAIVQRLEINGKMVTSKRTKKGALKDLVAAWQSIDPSYAPRSTVAKALGLPE